MERQSDCECKHFLCTEIEGARLQFHKDENGRQESAVILPTPVHSCKEKEVQEALEHALNVSKPAKEMLAEYIRRGGKDKSYIAYLQDPHELDRG